MSTLSQQAERKGDCRQFERRLPAPPPIPLDVWRLQNSRSASIAVPPPPRTETPEAAPEDRLVRWPRYAQRGHGGKPCVAEAMRRPVGGRRRPAEGGDGPAGAGPRCVGRTTVGDRGGEARGRVASARACARHANRDTVVGTWCPGTSGGRDARRSSSRRAAGRWA